ncbi:MAG TPA: hypothetical protein PKJ84_06335 [Anaerolineales bacterium]|nr:hypothetical protein [Anaerolineales bacterium]HNO93768.1 hypothetical protein [Anaerolineales bacterium]
MFLIQKGILPTIIGIVSFLLPAWVLFLDTKYILENLDTRIPEILGNSTKSIWLIVAMLYFFTMFFPIYFGMLLASIFPTIEIRRDGINFKYWEFLTCKAKWDEIESIIYYPNNYIVLRIDKRGLPMLNGLYFNSLQSKFLKSQLPILVLSPGLEKRDEVIREILKNSSPRIVQKK